MCIRKLVWASLGFIFLMGLIVTATDAAPASKSAGKLTREQVLAARKKFKVQVLSFDASQAFGTERPYSDYVRLRITNNSNVTLPYLTVLTKRYDASGRFLGSSRMPPIPTDNIKPDESFEYDYYPKGHFDAFIAVTKKITVEIEQVIDQESMQFFKELQ